MTSLLDGDYVRDSLVRSFEARFGIDEGRVTGSPPIHSELGWNYKKQGAVGQFRVDGFTFSKLDPYTDWNHVFGEAWRLWKAYAAVGNPSEVHRIAVRYVNRLRVQGTTDLAEYLVAPPSFPIPVPQTVREFVSRVVVEDSETNASAVIVQASEATLEPSTKNLLLDIDAYRTVTLQPLQDNIPELFEQLRSLKNRIFFACITERTAEMYE
jgi:uncharacterized protein (TIGR04255 family)